MPEMSSVANFSWVKRMSGQVPGRVRLTGLRSAIARTFLGDRSASPARPGVEAAGTSLAKWLEETAKVKSYIVEANTGVRQQMAGIQASIVFAQDHLAEDDVVGRQALKRKIDCAEKFHQQVCQFDRVLDDVMRVTALIPRLVGIIGRLSPPDLVGVVAPLTAPVSVDSSRKRAWITRQLVQVERELEQLDTFSDEVSACRVSACVTGLEAVVRLLTRHIDELSSELGHLVAVIDELDRLIVSA